MADAAAIRRGALSLRAALETVTDPFGRSALRLAADVLNAAVGPADAPINAARVNEIAFAFGDVESVAGDLGGDDAAVIAPVVAALRAEIDALRSATALPATVRGQIEALQQKLRIRKHAIERSTYVEGTAAPLPHPPEELKMEAMPIRASLANAGFSTPALDLMIEDPSSLRFHSIAEVIDELDVIVGA